MKERRSSRLVPTIRIMGSIVLLIGFVFNSLPVTGQTRPAGQRKTSSVPATKSLPGPGARNVELVRSRKSRTMSQAFANGKLPDPLRMPVGNIDAQATALAKAVSLGDQSSTAALHAAVLAAGFGVRDRDGSVMQTTERGQGLAFDAFEIATSSKLYGQDYGLTLNHLSEALTRLPEFNNVALAGGLLEGIRSGADSQHPAIRFWARFIVELGRNSATPYDLMHENDPKKIRLDAIQTTFILKRFLGEVAAVARRAQSTSARAFLHEPNLAGRGTISRSSRYTRNTDVDEVSFIDSGMRLSPPFAKRSAGIQSPCPASDLEGVILDYRALIQTTIFGQVMERLGGSFERYGKAAGVANLILTVLKLIASYALIKTEITIDGHPLARTKTTQPGEKKVLSAKITIDEDKWQMINCFRPALNEFGLDFNLPDAGPLGDVGVEWKLIEGGDSRGWMGTVQDIPDILNGNATWGDGIVFFDPVPGTDRSPAKQRTGEDGISRMGVTGVPQVRDMSKEKLEKVNKVAGVKIGIQFKSMKITDKTKLAATLGDLGGSVLAFLTGDFVGGVVGTGAETIYRSNAYPSAPFYFVVNDWEPCAGLWQGTMTTTSFVEIHTNETIVDTVKKHDASYKFEATVRFEGAKATATIEMQESIDGDQKSGYGRITSQQKYFANYSGDVEASAYASGGKYNVSFELPRMVGTYQSSGSCQRPAPLKCEQPDTIHKPWEFNDPRYISFISGDMDPNKPTEINDTKTIGEPGQLQHKITVNLKRCR